MKHILPGAALSLGLLTVTATAQDMMRGVDLSSPDMVSAEMTRTQVEAAIATATAAPADFTGKRLSNLDLSGLDLSRAIFRAARLNKTKLAGANLDHAVLDQAWLLEADLTGADVVTIYLATQLNAQLRPRLERYLHAGARVVSHDYAVPGWKPTKIERTDGKQGHVIYVYEMPPAKDPGDE